MRLFIVLLLITPFVVCVAMDNKATELTYGAYLEQRIEEENKNLQRYGEVETKGLDGRLESVKEYFKKSKEESKQELERLNESLFKVCTTRIKDDE